VRKTGAGTIRCYFDWIHMLGVPKQAGSKHAGVFFTVVGGGRRTVALPECGRLNAGQEVRQVSVGVVAETSKKSPKRWWKHPKNQSGREEGRWVLLALRSSNPFLPWVFAEGPSAS
jgi:hypothetical protein